MTTNKYIELEDSAFFEIKGIEKNSFLQGLITNDINKRRTNKSIYSAFLTPQGKFVADFFIAKLKDSFLFEIHEKLIDDLIKKLNFYKLRADVKLDKNTKYSSLAIYDKNKLFDNLVAEGDSKIIDNGIIFIDPRKNIMGLKVFIEKKYVKDFCIKYSLQKDSILDYDQKRIENLIPDSILDLKIHKSVLLENNFDSINAIDWRKGCYIGQEITARMRYRSLLKKSLTKIIIIKGNIISGDEIFFENKKIGNVSSFNNNIGLAMLRIEEAKKAYDNNINLKTKNAEIRVNF